MLLHVAYGNTAEFTAVNLQIGDKYTNIQEYTHEKIKFKTLDNTDCNTIDCVVVNTF